MTTTLPDSAELGSPVYQMHTVEPNLGNLRSITDRAEGRWRFVGMTYDA